MLFVSLIIFFHVFFLPPFYFLFFFPSRLADVTLRLGPYKSISCQKDIYTRTQLVHKSRQIKINHKTPRANNHDDPQIPQPDLHFAKRKQQTRQKRGMPQTNNNHTKKDLPRDIPFIFSFSFFLSLSPPSSLCGHKIRVIWHLYQILSS